MKIILNQFAAIWAAVLMKINHQMGRAFFAIFCREAITQGAVGKTQFEVVNGFTGSDTALFQIGQSLGTVLQGLVIIVDHLNQQFRALFK